MSFAGGEVCLGSGFAEWEDTVLLGAIMPDEIRYRWEFCSECVLTVEHGKTVLVSRNNEDFNTLLLRRLEILLGPSLDAQFTGNEEDGDACLSATWLKEPDAKEREDLRELENYLRQILRKMKRHFEKQTAQG